MLLKPVRQVEHGPGWDGAEREALFPRLLKGHVAAFEGLGNVRGGMLVPGATAWHPLLFCYSHCPAEGCSKWQPCLLSVISFRKRVLEMCS